MNDDEFKLHAELEDTHWWFRARREIIVDRFLRILPAGREQKIVEIGCGTGGNIRKLAEFYNVMGIDVSSQAIRYATKKIKAPVMFGDFKDILREHWTQIDGVLLADVLEHVNDDREFLGDIIAALKPGTLLVITVPALRFLWSRHDSALGHLRRYQKSDFRALWRGLPVREHFSSYFNALLFPLIALARLLMRRNKSQNPDKSSLGPVNTVLNEVLSGIFGMEKHILHWFRFPFGVSLIAVLEKLEE